MTVDLSFHEQNSVTAEWLGIAGFSFDKLLVEIFGTDKYLHNFLLGVPYEPGFSKSALILIINTRSFSYVGFPAELFQTPQGYF